MVQYVALTKFHAISQVYSDLDKGRVLPEILTLALDMAPKVINHKTCSYLSFTNESEDLLVGCLVPSVTLRLVTFAFVDLAIMCHFHSDW